MNPEVKDLLLILIAFGSGVLVPIAKDWLQRKTKEKQDSEVDLDMSDAAQKIASGSATISQAMETVLKPMIQRIADAEKEIAALKERKQERELQIRSLEYDMIQLRNQVENGERRYNELKSKYDKVVEFLFTYLRSKGETLPPDLVLLLGDSISRFKLKGEGK